MSDKKRPRPYPAEVRERSVRLVWSTKATTVPLSVQSDRVHLGQVVGQPRDLAPVGVARQREGTTRSPGKTRPQVVPSSWHATVGGGSFTASLALPPHPLLPFPTVSPQFPLHNELS
jgi:hypothetical protein